MYKSDTYAILFINFCLFLTSESALVSIDLGTSSIKVIKNQTSIVLSTRKVEFNEIENSRREIPNYVGFSEKRLFGKSAEDLLQVSPTSVVQYNQRLWPSDFSIVERLNSEYFVGTYKRDRENRVNYKIKSADFTTDEILAMQLDDIRKSMDNDLFIKDCVLVIPSFYSQAHKRNLILIAKSAKLNVLGLISENTASGLSFVYERLYNAPVHSIIYNIGASYIQVSLVKYSVFTYAEGTNHQRKDAGMEVLHHFYNKHFGGRNIDSLIADHITEKFKEKYGRDLNENEFFKQILISQSNQIKHFLSEKDQITVDLSKFFDVSDFKITIEKSLIDHFVSENSNLFLDPILKTLEATHTEIEDIKFIQTVGGTTEIPALKSLISSRFKLNTSNLDRTFSPVIGGALFGTNYTSEVQTHSLSLLDIIHYSVSIKIISKKSKSERVKEIFPFKSYFDNIKKIGLSSEEDLQIIVITNDTEKEEEILKYDINDIEYFSGKYQQPINIILTFKLDNSGIVALIKVEGKAIAEVDVKKKVKNEESKEDKTENNNNVENKEENAEDDQLNNAKVEEVQEEKELENVSDPEKNENSLNSQSENAGEGKKSEENEPPENAERPVENENKPDFVIEKVKKTHKLPLSFQETPIQIPSLISDATIKSFDVSLEAYRHLETESSSRLASKLDLQDFLRHIIRKLNNPEFQKFFSSSELVNFTSLVNSTQFWIESVNLLQTSKSVIQEKKSKISEIFEIALKKENEFVNRNETVRKALEKLEEMYNDMVYMNKTKTWVDTNLRKQTLNFISETITWINTKFEEQQKMMDWEFPVLKISTIQAKVIGVEKKLQIIRDTMRPRKTDL